MGTGSDEIIPVWGIEAGAGVIRAVRLVRRAEGGFSILDYLEGEPDGEGPGALVSFLRRRGIASQAMVIALAASSGQVASVVPSSEAEIYGPDELRSELLEHVHPEPEDIEFGYRKTAGGNYLILSEDRSGVEDYIAALESAEIPAYGLISSLDALVGLVRRSKLTDGDCVLVRLQRRWTEVVFLDGAHLSYQALPVGAEDLGDAELRSVLKDDIAKLIGFRRLQVKGKRRERIAILGLDAKETKDFAALLPERPVPFPADAGPIRGKGRISMLEAMRIIRKAPAAVGAAVAGAAAPRRLELAFRRLPDELPTVARSGGGWFAAAVLLWLALGAAWFGANRDVARLRREAEGRDASTQIETVSRERFESLVLAARRSIALPAAVRRLFREFPAVGEAALVTHSLVIRTAGDGGYTVEVDLTRDGERGPLTFDAGDWK